MNFAHGAIQWLAADVATTTYTVSGLPFQPKALRFYWQGLGSATDTASQATHSRRGLGFATGTAARRCVGSQDQDAAATMVCTTGFRDDCVAMTLTSTPAADGLLDLDAINSDGFRLIVDDQAPVNVTLFWEAWGGADLTVAALVDLPEPAATGNVDYTVTGFTSDGVGQVVMFAGSQATAASPTAARNDSGWMVGFATGVTGAENIVVTGNSDDASTSADCDGYCQTDECLASIVVGGGNTLSARATLTQWNTDGFRLNWIARAVTNRRYIGLAIKGGAWRAGAYTIAGNSAGATATVSGLPFAPIGVSLIGRMTAEQTAGTATAEDRIGLGSGSTPTDRRAMGHLSENAATSCEIDLVIEYDSVLVYPSTAGALLAAYDLNAMNADGFQVIVDTAGGVASEWQGYLAFGTPPITPPVGALGLVGQLASVLVNTIITPVAGALAAVGLAATVAAGAMITPPVGTLTLTGSPPAAVADTTIQPPAGSLALTGQAPTVSQAQDTAITPPAGAVWFGIEAQADRTPPVGALSLQGAAPVLVTDTRATPPAGALAVTGSPPTQAITVTPGAGALLLTGQVPTVTEGAQGEITPPAGTLSLTGQAPALLTPTALTPPAGSLTLTGAVPDRVVGTVLAPPAGNLALTGGAPTQVLAAFLSPPAGALTLTGAGPTQAITVTPPAGALAFTGAAPTVSDSGSTPTLQPPAAALTLTGQVPELRVATFLTPPAGALSLSGAVPIQGTSVTPGVGALTLTGQVPTVSDSSASPTIVPPAGSLALTGQAPTLVQPVSITPPVGGLSLAGVAGSAVQSRLLTPPAGAVTLAGVAPSLLRGSVAEPPTGALTLTGTSSTLGFDVRPAVGTLTLTGQTPTLELGFPNAVAPAGFLSPSRLTGFLTREEPVGFDAPSRELGFLSPERPE